MDKINTRTLQNIISLVDLPEKVGQKNFLIQDKNEYHLPQIYSYEENTNGFRSREFSGRAEFVAIGCSHTYGVGLPEEFIWPSFFANMCGITEFANLGKSGSNIAEQVRYLSAYILKYGAPKVVAGNFPGMERYEIVDKNGDCIQGSMKDAFYRHFSMDPTSVIHQNMQAILHLETICKTNKIKLVWQFWGKPQTEIIDFYRLRPCGYIHNKETDYWSSMHSFFEFCKEKNKTCFNSDKFHEKTCCTELKIKSGLFFDFAMDRFNVPRNYTKNPETYKPADVTKLIEETDPLSSNIDKSNLGHLGSHAHYHWAKNLFSGLQS
jgi:hypothetical protein